MNKAGFKICLSLYLAAVIFLCAIIGYIPAVTANAATQDSYYSDITATSGTQLLGQLHDLITTTHDTYTSYDDCKDPSIIKKTDAGSNSNSVMEFYSQADISSTWGSGAVGTWNREHVWCQSLSNGMWGTSGGGGDLHHIRPAESTLNSTRGNNKYGVVSNGTPVYYKDSSKQPVALGGYNGGGTFEPLDSVKGDVARIVLYVYTHYNTYSNVYGTTNGSGISSYFGTLKFTNIMDESSEDSAIDLLLEWNDIDPVDDIERNRNEAVYEIQGNRNPYIDNENYADAIWGDGTVDPQPLTLNKTTLQLSVGQTETLIATTTESGTVGWTTSDPSVATVSGGKVTATGEGSATITASIGGYSKTCKVTVTNTVAVDVTAVTLKVGEQRRVTATASGTVTWTSEDNSIATVDNGLITAVNRGKTMITVTCGTAKTQIAVTVIDENAGPTQSITISMQSFSNVSKYDFYEWNEEGVSGVAYLYKNGDKMQFNVSKSAYYLASTTPMPGRIVSVTVTLASGEDREWKLLTSDTPYGEESPAPTKGTDHGTKTVTTAGATWNIETTDTYFSLNYALVANSGVCYLDSVTIEYEVGGSTPHTHTEVTIPGKPATCTETGLMDGKKCSECGEILVEQQIIPVIPHADNDNDGMCDMCGKEMSVTQYTVTVSGGTIGDTGKNTAIVDVGQSVTVIADIPAGKSFSGWSADGGATFVSKLQTYTFTVTGDVVLTAVYDEVSQSTTEQFVAAVQSIESATGNSEKFEAINNAISLYNALTDEQKASVAAEYMQLQTAVEQYNEFVNDVNTQSANALQSVLLSTAFMAAALAAFLFLLEQKLL